MTQGDAELIATALGDNDKAKAMACEALYHRHVRLVTGICRRICKTQADVDDAAQETFAAAFRYLTSFRGECAFSTWLVRIAMRNAARVAAKHKRHEPSDTFDESGEAHDYLADPGATASVADTVACKQMLGQLSSDAQMVLLLFAVEGLTHGEIAEILGVPVGTIWSRLHAARKAAAKVL